MPILRQVTCLCTRPSIAQHTQTSGTCMLGKQRLVSRPTYLGWSCAMLSSVIVPSACPTSSCVSLYLSRSDVKAEMLLEMPAAARQGGV